MSSTANSMPPGDDVVASYLANRLSEDEAQAFEIYCLEHPEFARDVERDLALKTGLQQLNGQPAKTPVSRQQARNPQWPVALAASIVLFISGAAFFLTRPHDHATALVAYATIAELPPVSQLGSVSRVNLIHLRGGQSTTQAVASQDGVIELRLLPDFAANGGEYRVTIATEPRGAASPVTLRKLHPAADGFLLIYVPADQLIGRTSLISLGPDGDPAQTQETETFRVRFEAAPSPPG